MLNLENLKTIYMSLVVITVCGTAVAQVDVADVRSKKYTLKPETLQYFLKIRDITSSTPRKIKCAHTEWRCRHATNCENTEQS